MSKMIDMTGKRFGSWVVISLSDERTSDGKPKWTCKCDCGTTRAVSGNQLRQGKSTSCGSCKGNTAPFLLRQHNNRLYHAWSEMHRRCSTDSPQNSNYYHGRGISVCNQWNDFGTFAVWAVSNGYKPGLEIDRIDSAGDYCPSNCRWVSHKTNSRNRNARKNNRTGYPGISQRKMKSGRVVYRVTISSDNGRVNVGTFSTYEEAYSARRAAELYHWGFNIGE